MRFRSTPFVISLLLATGGCETPLACGENLTYDRAQHLCVCPNGGTHRDGLCYLDGSVTPLDGMVLGDAARTDEDAATDSGDVDGDGCVERTFHRDQDEDGFGDPARTVSACEAPDGYVVDARDCDDACRDCTPSGTETCDGGGHDEDCDGRVDEGLARLGAVVPVMEGRDSGLEYLASPIAAVPGVDGETIVIWSWAERQTAGDRDYLYLQRVGADGSPLGAPVELFGAEALAMLDVRVAAFAHAGQLVVVTATVFEFEWPRIALGVRSLEDLSVVHESRVVRRINEAVTTDLRTMGELAVTPLDDRDALVVLSVEGSTYAFVSAWSPPVATATVAPLPTPLGTGFEGVDLAPAGAGRARIAFGDGTHVRVGFVDGGGALSSTVPLGAGSRPRVVEANGRIGVLYADDSNRARFASFTDAAPPVPESALDLGAVVSGSGRLALAGFDGRAEWWAARVEQPTVGRNRTRLHSLTPQDDGYAVQDLDLGVPVTGTQRVVAALSSPAAVLSVVGDTSLRAARYGCE
ncbi:hypothetical protein [Sandaracinus amylolyticus]|uniref:hypothetical protein n=1 Tax=Sandaracinus amylolyticus TaxID=927083 RepID=UPI0012EE631E|nr:hypothetical protein [Sandaracinus amylolyticus]